MAKVHTALTTLFCLIAASFALADEFATIPAEAIANDFVSKDAEPLLAATLVPVNEDPDSKPADLHPKATLLSINDESDSRSADGLSRSTFRPVNRRFPLQKAGDSWRRSFPNLRDADAEIPYGNDMLVASDDNTVLAEEVPRDDTRKKHHHHHHHHDSEDSDSDDDEDDGTEKIALRRSHFKRRVTPKATKMQFRNQIVEKNQKNGDGGGFMEIVRKFLGHY